ncbi:LLM class flavin-dependent oxidoreductase [Saccharopolyspora sp. NPDC047091]|uniref:LLM class flavin-dependent oxidoreductase n=1 Tax=Saccharopolyspora sp. NPDC047091 TaxID=3155924 RepID=UPI0033E6B491
MTARRLHLGLMFWATGTHPAGWRHPSARADGAYDIGFIQQVSRIAEDAAFDFVFLGDRLATDPALARTNPAQMSRLEPFTAGAAIAAATSRIGIAVTANPTYHDPYSVARLTASLDHLSGGRASWNLVTGADAAAAGNFSRTEHWDTDRRYDRAGEFVDVVRALWDSGAHGAPIDHRGAHFEVDGPLDVPRPPQGQVVLLHAGTSERSRDLAAREADVVFSGHPDFESAREYYADVKARAAAHGRDPGLPRILPGLSVYTGATTRDAVAEYDLLNSFLPLDEEERTAGPLHRGGALGQRPRRNLTSVSRELGVDVRGHDPDEEVPAALADELDEQGRALLDQVRAHTHRDLSGEHRITYQDLIDGLGTGAGRASVVGDPVQVADFVQHWFDGGAADGFNIFPPHVPGSVRAFADLVVPELRRRGLHRDDYAGGTFRDHLGLDVPPVGPAPVRRPTAP